MDDGDGGKGNGTQSQVGSEERTTIVFVANLPFDATEADVRAFFAGCPGLKSEAEGGVRLVSAKAKVTLEAPRV